MAFTLIAVANYFHHGSGCPESYFVAHYFAHFSPDLVDSLSGCYSLQVVDAGVHSSLMILKLTMFLMLRILIELKLS